MSDAGLSLVSVGFRRGGIWRENCLWHTITQIKDTDVSICQWKEGKEVCLVLVEENWSHLPLKRKICCFLQFANHCCHCCSFIIFSIITERCRAPNNPLYTNTVQVITRMRGDELSPTKWDAAKWHMTPLVRSWPGVLEADPVMRQNMTLLCFSLFSFSFFLSSQRRLGCSSTWSEAVAAARVKFFSLQLRLTDFYFSSSSLFSYSSFVHLNFLTPWFSLLSLLCSTSLPSYTRPRLSLLLICRTYFFCPTHLSLSMSSFTCTLSSCLFLQSLLFPFLSFSHFTSGSSWVWGKVFSKQIYRNRNVNGMYTVVTFGHAAAEPFSAMWRLKLVLVDVCSLTDLKICFIRWVQYKTEDRFFTDVYLC